LDSRQLTRSRATTDAALRANERSVTLEDNAILRVDVSQLAANRPVEDFFSSAKCLSSNAHLFGVFDGHAGAACSRHTSTRLYDYTSAAVLDKHVVAIIPLNERLQWIFASADHRLPSAINESHERHLLQFQEKFKRNPDLRTVRKALQAAFVALDEDFSNCAMPDMSGQVCRLSANVAASGSCALVAHIRRSHLHVANVGDSAAVLGVSHSNAIVPRSLSRPHCVENVDEVDRIRKAHPLNENATVLKGGRLLGELYPLRAFGDVRYKWPLNLQRVVLEPLGVPPPVNLYTPPYLTASPEVFYHKLTASDKFLVLASDGLWEWLDPDTVVRLISDHTLGAQTLSLYQPQTEQTLGEVARDLEQRKLGESKKPLDENSATHVIRNALGGCSGGTDLTLQYARLQESLQLPPGMARHYRDDITVIVVHFNEHFLRANSDTDEPCGF
jgi:pyruvate dehydrogenase phosphatase